MQICFCSSFLTDEKEVIENSKIKPSVATHKFNLNILEGLKNNIGDDLTVINTEKVASFPNYKKIIMRTATRTEKNIGEYLNVGKINLPIFKDVTESIILYRILKKWILSQDDEDLYICGYGRRLSHVRVINRLKKKYPHIKTCMFLADLSGNAAVSVKQGNNYLKEKISSRIVNKQVEDSKKFDSFVLLTKYMADYLGVSEKPYTVIEGLCSECDLKESSVSESKNKIIAYTGILLKQYNVDVLIEAFKLIDDDNYKLWLFGDGEMNSEIKELSKRNSNVVFWGFLPNEDMKIKLSQVTVLVNPRQNNEEFTKYSFPSKNIEYMTLGKPVIGYKLDGIPDEYDDYLYYVNDNTPESLKNKIIDICELSNEKIEKVGFNNANFVRKNKNSTVQTRKILTMFDDMKG